MSAVTSDCGTKRAYLDHLAVGENCDVCREASNARRREQRRKSGVPARREPRCGTLSGRNQHYRNGEPVCRACRDSFNDYQRAYRDGESLSKVHDRATISELVVDVLETFGYAMSSTELAAQVTRIRPALSFESVRTVVGRMGGQGLLVEKEPGKWWTP